MQARTTTAIVIFAAAAGAARADAVVRYERPPPTYGRASAEVLWKHGELIRIDGRRVESPGSTSQQYTRVGQTTRFEIYRDPSGAIQHLILMEDGLDAAPEIAKRSFTGATQTLLGERCREWQISTPTSVGLAFLQSGCVTSDGIELWRKQANIDSIVARKIERGPVPLAVVTPPLRLLNPASWLTTQRPESHEADYEAVLAGGGQTETFRRSGEWVAQEIRGSALQFVLDNPRVGIRFRYNESPSGRSFAVDRYLPGQERTVRMNRPDKTLFGETCRWWDVMPNVADAGRHECRARDGAIMEIETVSRGSSFPARLSTFKRGPQPASAVAMPRRATTPSTWGF